MKSHTVTPSTSIKIYFTLPYSPERSLISPQMETNMFWYSYLLKHQFAINKNKQNQITFRFLSLWRFTFCCELFFYSSLHGEVNDENEFIQINTRSFASRTSTHDTFALSVEQHISREITDAFNKRLLSILC